MKKMFFIIFVSLIFAACGGAANSDSNRSGSAANGTAAANGGATVNAATNASVAATPAAEPGKMYLKFKEAENKSRSKDIVIKQGAVRVTNSAPKAAANLKTATYEIVLANYQFDPQKMAEADPKRYGDVLLFIQLSGENGATAKTPLKAGTYDIGKSADAANGYNKFWSADIKHFDDGVKEARLSTQSPAGTLVGQLKITSVADGKITGEIEISDNDGKIKGSFFADVPKN